MIDDSQLASSNTAHAMCERPGRVLAAAAVVFAAAMMYGLPVGGMLRGGSSQFQSASSQYERANAAFRRAAHQAAYYGVDVLLFGREKFAGTVAQGRGVGYLAGLLRRERGFERLLDMSVGARWLVSRDGCATAMLAAFASSADAVAAVNHVRGVLATRAGRVGMGGWRAWFGGPDVAFGELETRTRTDIEKVELIALPVILLLLVLVFGGAAALLPLMVGGVAVVVTLALLRVLDELGVQVSVYCLPAVTGLGLGLGIDYSLLLLARYREYTRSGMPWQQAARRVRGTAGRTVSVSSVTIAAALGCLLVMPLGFLSSIGLAAAVTALAAGAAARLLVPPALRLLDKHTRLAADGWRAWLMTGGKGSGRVGRWVVEHPLRLVVLVAGLLAAMASPVLGLRLAAPSAQLLPVGAESRQVETAFATRFAANPAAADPTLYEPPSHAALAALERTQMRAAAGRAVMLPRQYLGAGVWQLSLLPAGLPDSAANQRLLKQLRASIGPTGALVGGATAYFVDQKAAIRAWLPLVLLLLALVTLVALWVLSGSVVIAVKGMLMATLSAAAGIGLLVRFFGALEEANLVFMVAVTFALSTDYEIFLISRIHEHHQHQQTDKQAIAAALARTGPLISSAAVLFCVAVGAFAFASLSFARQFGLGAALTVAIDASLVRLLLLPALMTLIGRWNWWTPTFLSRLHQRITRNAGAVIEDRAG